MCSHLAPVSYDPGDIHADRLPGHHVALVSGGAGTPRALVWFLEPLDRDKGFLPRETELLFFGVTAGFFTLMIFSVDWADAAVVNSFLLVVEGARVVWTPVLDGTECFLYMGVVRGALCVQWLCGLVWGLDKWRVVFTHVSVLVCGVE